LESALRRFIDDAVARRDQLSSGETKPTEDEFAAELAALPSATDVDAAAVEKATANCYLVREPAEGSTERRAGRTLTARALTETGVAGALLAGEDLDAGALAAELAQFLAGPSVPVWEYAILDADVTLSMPIEVVDGWELATPTKVELAALIGLPSTARYAEPRKSLNLDLYPGLAMLRRVDPDGSPHSGLILYWNVRPAHSLWQPLLALSLFHNAVVQLWAQYDVEPARRVDVLFDRVYTEPWTPDGVTEIEVVRHGDYVVDAENETRLRRFLAQTAPLFARAVAEPVPSTKGARERVARFRRVAEHFLTASERAHGEGEVLSELNADAVLHYVIALEGLLTGDESERTELTRKVVQRAAVLAGRDDEERRAIAQLVKDAYGARSAYAHGSEPDSVDLPSLRRVVRDAILTRLVIGDPTPKGQPLAKLADNSLLDHRLLADSLRIPVDQFWAAVDSQ
jgi:hypothetical protein